MKQVIRVFFAGRDEPATISFSECMPKIVNVEVGTDASEEPPRRRYGQLWGLGAPRVSIRPQPFQLSGDELRAWRREERSRAS